MDFPIFHLDFIGNRLLIAITAIIHVIVNHPMAVGAVPLAVYMEWRSRREQRPQLDDLAKRITFVYFIIATSLGAMTGVGIWFTTAMVNPDAIGSLLRIFFWAWFFEWIVFVVEVALILWYYLSWKPPGHVKKTRHMKVGLWLATFSWFTMMIITAILAFMMDPGAWEPHLHQWSPQSNMLTAFFNPLYWPQLAFRTPFALMAAGLFFLFLTPFFTQKKSDTRRRAVRMFSAWTLIFLPLTAAAGLWYWKKIPTYMAEHAPIAFATQNYADWYNTILTILLATVIIVALINILNLVIPKRMPALLVIIPFIVSIALLGYFERIREFIRKPYVIKDYMYANGLRVQDYALYKQDGLLEHATFVTANEVTEENKLIAGKDVFMLACSRCHTLSGVNSLNTKFNDLFPGRAWKVDEVSGFIANMHNIRQFMPPFPGNEAERDALSAFIVEHQNKGFRAEGAQSDGVRETDIIIRN